ncbi:MAG: M81 family peptidase [Mesorhizobium sp.]|nr:MAG: M81 family peptidase [Mesorhizobium sp.]
MMEQAPREEEYDAIILSLHGAMMTAELDDPEGALMTRLRSVVGNDVVITCGFDLHAHVTDKTLSPCDFITAYRTNPHGDMGVTGARLFHRTKDIFEGRFEPICAYVHFPMLTLGRDRTDEYPLEDIMSEARRAEEQGHAVDVSIFTVQQFLDVPNMGQTVLAYGNGSHEEALAAAKDIAALLWEAREDMIATYPTLAETIVDATQPTRSRPVIVGDQGDRVAAGGAGDSTFILSHLLETPHLRALIPITDPDAVHVLAFAQIGSSVKIRVGGKLSGSFEPLRLEAVLISRGEDANYVQQGPNGGGLRASTGPYAVLRHRNLHVILTERPSAYIDPQNFAAFGLLPSEQQPIVTRSGYHFTLNFASTGDCVTINTPGITAYRPEELPFSVARPFYPIDDIQFEPATAIRARAS